MKCGEIVEKGWKCTLFGSATIVCTVVSYIPNERASQFSVIGTQTVRAFTGTSRDAVLFQRKQSTVELI